MTEKVMVEKFYVFAQRGPYNWEQYQDTSGPYYNEKEWFDLDGYESEELARNAIKNYYESDEVYLTPTLFIQKGYSFEYPRD